MTIKAFGGYTPQLGQQVWVDDSAVIIGDVVIGDDSSVWPHVSIRGDMHWIRIGQRTSIQDNACLHITHASDHNPDGFPLQIGDDVTIGHQAMLHGCTIGNQVLVGMAAIILDGAIIDDNVVIGAGALVPPGKQLESGYLYLGSPVKQIRKLTDQEKAYFKYACQNYVRLKNDYLAEQSST
ncbi:carbonic anhydrase, family 3 [Methylophaga frappieri]|uniref:Carbonic anhydrase, family 3 n=1 Tax=Methylophaga frappieri (strain ATCC BAA-2434 / DSM 25690 / JAM7) TaxID=754477 RepID=I1YHV8_METFJ|nr:gamma carbonic anhydrase family protein [Methylophaga frappieri]AFJ02501.1 carbonic anhydrase, family 3 [Methylophaga frappieri]